MNWYKSLEQACLGVGCKSFYLDYISRSVSNIDNDLKDNSIEHFPSAIVPPITYGKDGGSWICDYQILLVIPAQDSDRLNEKLGNFDTLHKLAEKLIKRLLRSGEVIETRLRRPVPRLGQVFDQNRTKLLNGQYDGLLLTIRYKVVGDCPSTEPECNKIFTCIFNDVFL